MTLSHPPRRIDAHGNEVARDADVPVLRSGGSRRALRARTARQRGAPSGARAASGSRLTLRTDRSKAHRAALHRRSRAPAFAKRKRRRRSITPSTRAC